MKNIWKKFFAKTKPDAEPIDKVRELEARLEMAEAEGRLREAILNSMSDGIAALDQDLRITLVNPRFCSFFGNDFAFNSASQKSGKNNWQGVSLLEFSRSAELEETAQQVLATGLPLETSIRRYTSGTEQHFRVFAAPLGATPLSVGPIGVTPPGENRGVIIVLGDISRLAKLEQIRKDFAANVSHELRTPIQVIKGFVENLLNSSLDDKDEIRRFGEIIRKNAETMENLTGDLLTLVSLEDGDAERPAMKETFLAPLIAEAIDAVEIAAKKKNISIEISCPPDLAAKLYGPFVFQALVNLLDNGIKYSSKGSRIKVNAFREEGYLIIEVKDKGIGIPAEHLGRIFERFYRVNRSRSREEGGTGLGLAIVRHIALLHQGSAEVESHAGEGSVFRLRIPAGC